MVNINEVKVKVLLIITYICSGLYRYIPGPTFIDLAARINEDLLTMPLLLAARSIGYIVAYILGTFLFHRFLNTSQKPLLFFLVVFIMSVTAYSMSICTTFVTLSITFCAAGVCLAAVDTGANAFYLHVCGQLDYLYFQSLHLFCSTGAFAAPLVARNYIREQVNITDITERMGPDESQNIGKSYYITPVSSAYVIVSAMLFVVSLLWLANCIFRSEDIEIENIVVEEAEELCSCYKQLIIFNSSILKFFMNTVDFSYTQVLPVYCVLALELTPPESANLMVIFLGCHVSSRLLSTIIAIRVCPHNMLSLAVVLIFCGAVFLFWNGHLYHFSNYLCFLVGNCLIGLGAGPMHPALLDWLCHKMYISHRNVVPIFLMGALSDLVVPALLSKYLWHHFFTIYNFVLGVAAILIALLVFQCVLIYGPKTKHLYHPTRPQPIPQPASVIYHAKDENRPVRQQPPPAICQVRQEDERVDLNVILNRLGDVRYQIDFQNADIRNILNNLDYRNTSSTDISIVQKSA